MPLLLAAGAPHGLGCGEGHVQKKRIVQRLKVVMVQLARLGAKDVDDVGKEDVAPE